MDPMGYIPTVDVHMGDVLETFLYGWMSTK